MTFLECYEKWMEAGRLPNDGLCNSLHPYLLRSNAWELIKPTVEEMDDNFNYGGGYFFWGSENISLPNSTFTPQRQTIMLVAAALNGEFD